MKTVTLAVLVLFGVTMQSIAQGWSIQTSPVTQNLYAVAHGDANTWVAVGDAGVIIRSNDGGILWASVSSPVADALRGVALHGNLGLAVGIAGRVLRTTDAGLNWIEETRPTTRNLYAVSISNYMAVITGEEGTILVSYDAGLTWNPHTAGTASILFGVSVNDSTAVGVGGQGAIVMSTDGGVGWGLTVPGNQLTFFYSTSFVKGSTGWAVGSSSSPGNVLIHSNDYGFVWTAETAPTSEQLFGVSFSSLLSGGAVGGNGTIIHTSDGGTTWTIQPGGTIQILNSIAYADSLLGIVVGDGGTILRTTNGGLESIEPHSTLNAINLNPNPAKDFVTIDVDNLAGPFEISIYSIPGKLIRKEPFTVNHQKIDISGFNNGTYLVKVKTESLTEYRKLIINR